MLRAAILSLLVAPLGAAEPSADEIVERCWQALGGRDSWQAVAGGGAWLGERRLRVSSRRDPQQADGDERPGRQLPGTRDRAEEGPRLVDLGPVQAERERAHRQEEEDEPDPAK